MSPKQSFDLYLTERGCPIYQAGHNCPESLKLSSMYTASREGVFGLAVNVFDGHTNCSRVCPATKRWPGQFFFAPRKILDLPAPAHVDGRVSLPPPFGCLPSLGHCHLDRPPIFGGLYPFNAALPCNLPIGEFPTVQTRPSMAIPPEAIVLTLYFYCISNKKYEMIFCQPPPPSSRPSGRDQPLGRH